MEMRRETIGIKSSLRRPSFNIEATVNANMESRAISKMIWPKKYFV